MLDGAGLTECKIVASNSLDEYLIRDLLLQGAAVDVFGVGERLITSRSTPVFGGVYKLVAVEDTQGNILPKIKMSENIGKITTPHFKSVFRFYDRKSGKALADEICLFVERIAEDRPHTVFDPAATWKRKTLTDFTVKKLLVPVFRNGVCVYKTPPIEEIQTYCREQVALLWDEVKRFENPHAYYVDLSENLWQVKQKMLREYGAPLSE